MSRRLGEGRCTGDLGIGNVVSEGLGKGKGRVMSSHLSRTAICISRVLDLGV